MPKSDSQRAPGVDWVTFSVSLGLIVLTCLPLVLAPEAGERLVAAAYAWIAQHFGIAYQWATLGMTGFLIWLALSRYGSHRLGSQDDRPEFSTWSWMAMLFCAGIGAGLLYWSTIEWAYYIDSPPFGLAPSSVEATEWAATYGMFHWGVSAWCIYCFPAVVIGYPYYRRKVPFLRLSTGLHEFVAPDGDLSGYDRWPARLVDVIYILALVGGTGTSIGLVSPMIAACISKLTGLPESLGLSLSILLACVAMFGTSVYLGLERGIRRLSDFNAFLAIALALVVLVLGPTVFLLETTTNAIGLMLQNFVRMNTYTDPIGRTGFVEDWTVFYWAWWIAYGPFMGLFVTRISKGRTLRQMIFSMLGFGTFGCLLFYGVFGNYSLWLDLEGKADIRGLVAADRAATAVAETLATLPMAPLMLGVFIVVAFVFVATTYDSGSYTIAASATRNLRAGVEPARWHRVFWAAALGILPATLIFVSGLRTVQSVVLVVSLPVMVVLVLMGWSFLITLRQADAEQSDSSSRDDALEARPQTPVG